MGVVPEERLARLSSRFHVIGDIAILYLDPELDGYKYLIASALLDQCRNVHTVFNKITPWRGRGEPPAWSFWQARVFFNSRLGYERMRVAGQVKAGEEVLVLFAGVGSSISIPSNLTCRRSELICEETI